MNKKHCTIKPFKSKYNEINSRINFFEYKFAYTFWQLIWNLWWVAFYSGSTACKLFCPSDSINKAIENIFDWNTVMIVFLLLKVLTKCENIILTFLEFEPFSDWWVIHFSNVWVSP